MGNKYENFKLTQLGISRLLKTLAEVRGKEWGALINEAGVSTTIEKLGSRETYPISPPEINRTIKTLFPDISNPEELLDVIQDYEEDKLGVIRACKAFRKFIGLTMDEIKSKCGVNISGAENEGLTLKNIHVLKRLVTEIYGFKDFDEILRIEPEDYDPDHYSIYSNPFIMDKVNLLLGIDDKRPSYLKAFKDKTASTIEPKHVADFFKGKKVTNRMIWRFFDDLKKSDGFERVFEGVEVPQRPNPHSLPENVRTKLIETFNLDLDALPELGGPGHSRLRFYVSSSSRARS